MNLLNGPILGRESRRSHMKFKSIALAAIFLLNQPSFSEEKSTLIVHEWGTFASFMGSQGKREEGLHHEDEPLPGFVYGLKKESEQNPTAINLPRLPIGMERKVDDETFYRLAQENLQADTLPQSPLSAGITQKMETPVIYFYGDIGEKVKVEIDFPEGIITQYFPQATQRTPKLNEITSIGPSHFQFDVTLQSIQEKENIPSTSPDSIWNPAREVKANTIKVGNQSEKFIFYRGVGDFNSQFKVKSDSNDILSLENHSDEIIRDAYILNSDGVTGVFKQIGPIQKKTTVNIPSLSNGLPLKEYVSLAKSFIAKSLMAKGLYYEEALAMANTWEKSYFHTPGIRILYIVPNIETEKILPLRVTPTPKELVRTLVGRVEIMTHSQEQEYLKMLATENVISPLDEFGRFYDPKLRRLLSIAKEQQLFEVIDKINTLLL
jgi:hypothetical protein